MAGKKKKAGKHRRQSSHKPQHSGEYSSAGQSSEEESANHPKEPARKQGKSRNNKRTQRVRGQKVPERQIRPKRDMGGSGNLKQPDDDLSDSTEHGWRVKVKKRRLSRKVCYCTEDDTEEGEEEDNLGYHTAEEGNNEEEGDAKENLDVDDTPLLPENCNRADKDDSGNQEMGSESNRQAILRNLEELRKALDDSEDGDPGRSDEDPGRAFNPDGQQETCGLGDPSATENADRDGEKSWSEFFELSTRAASAYGRTIECIPGLEGNNTVHEADLRVYLADSHAEATHADSATLVNPGFNGPTAEERYIDVQSASDQRTNTKSSPRKMGIAARIKATVWNIPKALFQRDVEEVNYQHPKPENIRVHLGEGSNLPASEILRAHAGERWSTELSVRENHRTCLREQTLAESALRFPLGMSGHAYEGEIAGRKMHGFGRLTLSNQEFITGYWNANRLMDLTICQLHYKTNMFTIVKRFDDYLLTIFEKHFAATAALNSTDQLDFNKNIWMLKEEFFGKLTILEVLQDELEMKKEASSENFVRLLNNMTCENADPVIRANIFILLRKYSSDTVNTKICDFLNDQNVPSVLKNEANNLLTRDSEYRYMHNSFKFLKQVVPSDLRKMMAVIYKDRIADHRESLIGRCPSALPSLKSQLQNLDESKILYVTRADIEVFDQLASHPFSAHYRYCLENLVKRFGQTFEKISTDAHPSAVIPIMSPVFEFLVRSLWEIVSEIVEVADDCDYKNMLKCKSGKWKMEQKIKWPNEENQNAEKCFMRSSENKRLLYHRALEVQYKCIFGMLEQIFPDCYISNRKCDYRFCVLGQDLSQNGPEKAIVSGGLPARFKNLSEGRLAWLYLLDHTVHEVFKNDPEYLDVLNPLFQGHVRFIENSPTESHESFRALTHNIVKFVTSSAPYVRVTTGELDVDVKIIFQQISTASQNVGHEPLAFSNFRDLLAEYNRYLSLRHFIDVKAAPGYFSAQLSRVMQTFMRIVETSLKKSVPTPALVVYFRCLNDFLDDFRNIDFLAMWYVKTLGKDDPEAMELVENKLSGDNCSYRVTDIEKFVSKYERHDFPPPHHYIIQIVAELLGCIEKCLDKPWQSDDCGQQVAQLKTTGIMLDAIRRSFMYLKEQPDYVEFKTFKKESVDPFVRLVDECSTLTGLKTRADIVKESFWYLRKMDEIGIDQALTLFKDSNTDHDSEKLLRCYNLYLGDYNKYIETYTSLLSGGKSHEESLDAVKQMLKPAATQNFSRWTEEFKTREIPTLLAGLSAIWSILVSKDLSSTGKFLKPHCIQVLCILRLVSADQSERTDNHLAQVLTGQGKSVILGLLSSILALTGHDVRVLCYSSYLSSRDQSDFADFFQIFQIADKINYGTFKDMANDFMNPTCNGSPKSLRRLVEDRVLKHASWPKVGCVTRESDNTVLLIDEVDVFFTENFYGNTHKPLATVHFRGLVAVQEKIWSLALTKKFGQQEIVDRTRAFIRDETAAGNTHLADLNAFLNTPGKFSLLKKHDNNLTLKTYTNQTLFEEHLQRMASDAISVATEPYNQRHFKINGNGIICFRSAVGIFTNDWCSNIFCGYLNTFNYFRLKISNFDHKYFQNYGYLILDSGKISFSLLPSQFRLILGVSGTVKNLSDYEMSGIKSYNIHNTTILPSFYGESNLLFDEEEDFHYIFKEQDWLEDIYKRANRIVQSGRAVLIFFESDLKMDLFSKEYKIKFDRFNEITANTLSRCRDAYVDEAGLPGAVTLASRNMGRGVDYKSSLSVEKHGGVHVIQTFYSTDVKEEIQIKGRTARKDNKGSYEMVICREHLVKDGIITIVDTCNHNYATLDEIRQKLSAEKGKTVNEKIIKSERDHKVTMEYFGLA